MALALFSIALFFGASYTIWSADRKIFSGEMLPWGSLWVTGFFVYIFAPAILDALFQTSIFQSIPEIHQLIVERKLLSGSLLGAGFSVGYASFALSSFRWGLGSSCRLEALTARTNMLKSRPKDDILFLVFVGFLTILSLSSSHIFDGFDRYNSAALEGPLARIVQSSGLTQISLYYFFYGIANAIVKSIEHSADKGCKSRNHNRNKIRQAGPLILTVETVTILLLVLKTGSRSILLGCILSSCFAYLMNEELRANAISFLAVLFIVLAPVLAVSFEAIRIARSESDFYKANPIYMTKQLSSSLERQGGIRKFAYANRREAFNEAAFLDAKTCEGVIDRYSVPVDLQLRKRLLACSYGSFPRDYKGTNPLEANGYLSKLLRRRTEFDYSGFRLVTAKNSKSVSRGEKINLTGELYLRGGYVATFVGGILMGAIYFFMSLVVRAVVIIVGNQWFTALAMAIPLGLTSGALLLPIDGQFWLALVQLPKVLLAAYLVGALFEYVVSNLKLKRLKQWQVRSKQDK